MLLLLKGLMGRRAASQPLRFPTNKKRPEPLQVRERFGPCCPTSALAALAADVVFSVMRE
ncbi:MAG: hypothetical protein ACN6PP_27075 [Delftia tsuruhatensis]